MKELSLRIRALRAIKTPYVMVDNVPVKLKKKGIYYCATCCTEKDSVEVEVAKYYELESKHWFWWGLLYFFVSIFGIFEPPMEKGFAALGYKATVMLTDAHTDMTLELNPFKDNIRAIKTVCSAPCTERLNKYFVKSHLKKRRRALIWTKIGIWLVAIAAALIAVLVKTKN